MRTIYLNVILLLTLFLPGPVTKAATPETNKPIMSSPDDESKAIINAPATEHVNEALQSAPLMFIENVGQFDDEARFQLRGANGTLWLTEDGLWVTVLEKSRLSPRPPDGGDPSSFSATERVEELGEWGEVPGVNLKLSFPGANPQPHLEPFNRLETSVNYFLGNDPAQWQTNVPVWGGVRYKDLYPGIDLEITSEGGQMVQRVVARPGANLNAVRLRVEGADAVSLLPSPRGRGAGGEGLRLTTAVGEFSLPLLTVEGTVPDGQPETLNVESDTFEVTAPFSLSPSLRTSVSPQDNPSDLLYATFLGGGGRDEGWDIAVDGAGAAYVTGETWSSDFPTTPGAFDTTFNGGDDAFVVKLNPASSALAYATFLGGDGNDYGSGIAVDASGAAYVTGSTDSSDFPTTPGAFDTTYNGGTHGIDAFVVKLNPAGSVPAYATFLGGGSSNRGRAIAVDGSGAAYVTGETASSHFPTTPGAFDTTLNGTYDAFVVKLNSTGAALAYATFLGGWLSDYGEAIAVDGNGAAYVTGWTESEDFPTTPGAFDTTYPANRDAFVVKLNPSGTAPAYATFLGGSDSDSGNGIAVDANGAAYVTGETWSYDFPTTPGAFDTTRSRYKDAFVVKLNPAGSALAYATFLGGGTMIGAWASPWTPAGRST